MVSKEITLSRIIEDIMNLIDESHHDNTTYTYYRAKSMTVKDMMQLYAEYFDRSAYRFSRLDVKNALIRMHILPDKRDMFRIPVPCTIQTNNKEED